MTSNNESTATKEKRKGALKDDDANESDQSVISNSDSDEDHDRESDEDYTD